MLKPSEVFKESLNKLLELSGWSQAELGRRLKIAPTAINRWVSGEVTPQVDTIAEIASAFGIDLCALLQQKDFPDLASLPPHSILDCLAVINKVVTGDHNLSVTIKKAPPSPGTLTAKAGGDSLHPKPQTVYVDTNVILQDSRLRRIVELFAAFDEEQKGDLASNAESISRRSTTSVRKKAK